MESPNSNVFFVADWAVYPLANRISYGEESIQLEPKTMMMLEYMSAHAGEVVSRDELEAEIWRGRVVSYDAVTNTVGKIRKAFHDDPKAPKVIETLSKKGYRLVAAVDFDATISQEDSESNAKALQNPGALQSRTKIIAVLLVSIALLITVVIMANLNISSDGVTQLSLPRSIAVLPFENRSGSPEQDYFADGITDDLITALAKNPDLLVIARDSSFHYKRESPEIKKIASKLNVNYILHGSVQRIGDQVRVHVKLADVTSGRYLWAEIYNSDIDNITSIENGISHGVLASLLSNVSSGEKQDLGYPTTPKTKAYDSFLQGRQLFYMYLNRVENQRARELFERAITADKNFALAYAMLAWTHVFDVMNGWSDDRKKSLRDTIAIAGKAISLQKNLPLANFVTGLAYRESGQYIKAMAEVEKAIQADPNYANAHLLSATLLYYAGLPLQGLERVKKAIKLNPHHPYNYSFHLGQAYFVLGRYDDAIAAFIKGINSNPSTERLHVWLAAAYAQQGNLEEADWEATQVMVINPKFSIDHVRELFPFKDQEDRDHFVEGLTKAGLR